MINGIQLGHSIRHRRVRDLKTLVRLSVVGIGVWRWCCAVYCSECCGSRWSEIFVYSFDLTIKEITLAEMNNSSIYENALSNLALYFEFLSLSSTGAERRCLMTAD